MLKEKTRALFDVIGTRYAGQNCARMHMLLAVQCSLLLLLTATVALIFIVDSGTRLTFYLLLTLGLALPLVAGLVLNIRGCYKAASWLTVLVSMAAPWLCLLGDNTILSGDIMPLVYVALSIQLCSILLSERVTLVVSLVQFGCLAVLILVSPGLQRINWPSLIMFMLFVATLGIVAGILNRRQMEQIEKDHSMLQQSEARFQALAVRDSLTGLFNRRYMEETLEREISRAKREKRYLGIIMTDVDGFKLINDSFGHVLGDTVLSHVAEILNRNIRKSDVACRFGGDEFILILPECSLEDTMLRAQSLRRLVEDASFLFDDADVGRVTLSMGVSALPDHGSDSKELMRAADRALYAAKKNGRNRVVTARVKATREEDGGQPVEA
jgi:diguanylate cyclase (GGDEF)-like protein